MTAALVLACSKGGEPPRAPDSVTAAPPVPEVAADSSAPAGGGCPAWGLWRECSVVDRLTRAGLVFEQEDTVRHEWLSVPGAVYRTPRGTEVQVFIYASEASRRGDSDQLDTVGVHPRQRRIVWRHPATLVTSNNLMAIILGLNGRQVERIALALGAGLPAAPSR
jgi:hypothetical protein